jgi:hypothetical protein
VTGIEPPLKGTPRTSLECLGTVYAVLDTVQVPLITVRSEPLTDNDDGDGDDGVGDGDYCTRST